MATQSYGNYTVFDGWNRDPKFKWERTSGTTTLNEDTNYCSTTGSIKFTLKGVGVLSLPRTLYTTIKYQNTSGGWGSTNYNGQKMDSGINIHWKAKISGTNWPTVYVGGDSPTGYGIKYQLTYKITNPTGQGGGNQGPYYFIFPSPKPFFTANVHGSSKSISCPSSTYEWSYFTLKASANIIANDSSVRLRVICINTGEVLASSDSNTINCSKRTRFTTPGRRSFEVQVQFSRMNGSWTGWQSLIGRHIDILEIPPGPPTMGEVNNTTVTSVDTSSRKRISANWVLDYNGKLPTSFVIKCYKTNTGQEIYSTSGNQTSASFDYNLELNENTEVYWVITAVNSKGSDSTTSGRVRIHRTFTEPSNMSNLSITPIRVMMLNNHTTQLYNLKVNMNSWGDRWKPSWNNPGNKTRKIRLFQCFDNNRGQQLYESTFVGDATGNKDIQIKSTVDESYFGRRLKFRLEKQIADTVYNNTILYTEPVEMYEVPAVCTGDASVSRSVITTGKSLVIDYSYHYEKWSSEKVQFILEIYDDTADRIFNSFTLQTITKDTDYSGKQSVIPFPTNGDEEHKYYVRLKSIVTELLGNKTIKVLCNTPLKYFYPPVVNIVQNPTAPLNADRTIITMKSDIEYDVSVVYTAGIDHAEMVVTTSYGVVKGDIINGEYYWDNPGELKLDSIVSAYVVVYYDLGGIMETYETAPVQLKVTPTRYVVYHTDNLTSEKRNPKLWLKNGTSRENYAKRISYKQG